MPYSFTDLGHTTFEEVTIMSEIKCKVEECHFNRDHYCDASEIEVVSCGTADVKTSDQTECHTFRERGGSMK